MNELDFYYDETFRSSFAQGFGSSYQQAKQGAQEDYSKYADVAQRALAKAKDAAQNISKQINLPLPLLTAMIAAGITGGPASVPFSVLLYYAKQPLMRVANRGFDAAWDTGAGAIRRTRQMASPQQQQSALQPENFISRGSFMMFVEADSWGDWAGETAGRLAGRIAGNVAGFGGKITSALGNRMKEMAQWAKNNPKEIARMAFLVGMGALIGAGIGRLTHKASDLIIQKMKENGIPVDDLSAKLGMTSGKSGWKKLKVDPDNEDDWVSGDVDPNVEIAKAFMLRHAPPVAQPHAPTTSAHATAIPSRPRLPRLPSGAGSSPNFSGKPE